MKRSLIAVALGVGTLTFAPAALAQAAPTVAAGSSITSAGPNASVKAGERPWACVLVLNTYGYCVYNIFPII